MPDLQDVSQHYLKDYRLRGNDGRREQLQVNYINYKTNKELPSLLEKNDRGTKWQDSHFATRSDPKGEWQEP